MYLQFVFLESLFYYMMHKLEECVVIAILFVVGLLFILMFSCPWQEIKSDFAVFSHCPLMSIKKYLFLIFFIDLLVMQLSNKAFAL